MGEKKRREGGLRERINARIHAPDHRLPPSACLDCGTVLDGATITDSEDVAPHPGAISICFYCGHIQAFGDDLRFRPLTDEEIIDIAGHPEIVMAGTVLKPWRELHDQRDALTEKEIEARLTIIIKAMVKAERSR
jgi:hypothetical protein